MKPVWRYTYTWPKMSLLEMLKEIMAGTFHSNTDSTFTRNMNARREILLQCKERGLCNFSGEDCNAHLVPLENITIIPQPEQPQRGEHK